MIVKVNRQVGNMEGYICTVVQCTCILYIVYFFDMIGTILVDDIEILL